MLCAVLCTGMEAAMKYHIKELADLAGVSARTLRYYDEIGLLSPSYIDSSGYRIFEEKQVDRLQQILFYRELGMELKTIQKTLDAKDFNLLLTLKNQRQTLIEKKLQLEQLILNLTKTIQKEEGKKTMTDKEKFEGFKKELVDQNERLYGEEIQRKYGSEVLEQIGQKVLSLSQEEYHIMQSLEDKILALLEAAVQNQADPSGPDGQEIASLHKTWLLYTWSSYTTDAHRGLAQLYVADPRFTSYYDKNISGCAEFLKKAIEAFTQLESLS